VGLLAECRCAVAPAAGPNKNLYAVKEH
jgi:hypothetical protein